MIRTSSSFSFQLILWGLVFLSAADFSARAERPLAQRVPVSEHLSPRRGLGRLTPTVSDSTPILTPLSMGTHPGLLSIEITDLHNLPGRRYGKLMHEKPGWGVVLRSTDNREYRIRLKADETESNGIGTTAGILLELDSAGHILYRRCVPGILAAPGKRERLSLRRSESKWSVSVVSNRIYDMGELPIPSDFSIDSLGVYANRGGLVKIESIRTNPEIAPADLQTGWSDLIALSSHLERSSDILEGYWQTFDYTLDTDLLRLGGNYRLAIVRDGDRYLLIYLDGAQIDKQKWKSGMLKGELHSSGFPGIWETSWIDASFSPMTKGIKAFTTDNGTILTIEFPYQESSLRLRRLEKVNY